MSSPNYTNIHPGASTSTASIPALSKDFHLSTASPSRLFRFPGVTAESTIVTRRLLTENDRRYDIWNQIRYHHNHLPHSILTRYALGAPPKLLEDTYKYDIQSCISIDPESPERQKKQKLNWDRIPKEITRDNWDDPKYLGFDNGYAGYLAFFHSEIDRLGPINTLKEYVFSPKANWEGRNPQMLIRLLSGFYHPFIHVGFGLEFQDRIILAEGLAQACVHKIDSFEGLFPNNYPSEIYSSCPDNPIPSPTSLAWTPSPLIWSDPNDPDTDPEPILQLPRHPTKGLSLLEIYDLITSDPRCAPIPYNPNGLTPHKLVSSIHDGDPRGLLEHAKKWVLEEEDLYGEGLEYKLEEVAVFVTLLSCATGKKDREGRIDFFLMHALTSSLFLPSFLPHLSIPERKALLESYILVTFALAISKGRPKLDAELLMSYPLYPVPPKVDKGEPGDVISDPRDKETGNRWTGIVESCLYARDSHVPKAIRALVHYSTIHGDVPKGGIIGAFKTPSQAASTDREETIPGSAELDGTLYIRAAGLIMDTLGWCREGAREGDWDRSLLGYDEAWE